MVPGKVGVATGGMVQQDLFGDRCEYGDRGERPAEPVLMALHAEYYELIWRGLKTHEFRRRFLEGRPARWFVYLNAPVSRLTAVIDLSADEFREELGRFHPPQGYVRLAQHPEMLAVCEKAAAEEPIRWMTVHHR